MTKPRLRTRIRDAWKVLREGLPEASVRSTEDFTLPAAVAMVVTPHPPARPPAPITSGSFRVTRENPKGHIVETLYQGEGAIAAQCYQMHSATQPDEWIVFYRGNEACSGKSSA